MVFAWHVSIMKNISLYLSDELVIIFEFED